MTDKPKPALRFICQGNSTVNDTQTGMLWQRYSLGVFGYQPCASTVQRYNWRNAVQAARAANTAGGMYGYCDWRLPTLAEMQTLLQPQPAPPMIDSPVFPATASALYWTSTEQPGRLDAAWGLDFANGRDSLGCKKRQGGVRLVRGRCMDQAQ